MVLSKPCSFHLPWCLAVWVVWGTTWCAAGASDDRPDRPSFNRDVRPILAANCLACHGPDDNAREADLRLDTVQGATADLGGYQAIVPGDPEASELLRRVASDDDDERMPPPESNKTLTAAERETLRQWIADGAAYAQHWAFVAPQRPAVPEVDDPRFAGWSRTAVDRFILERMLREGLTPNPEADVDTLIRRLFLDLIGLPPTVEEAQSWRLRLREAQATEGGVMEEGYQQLVDHLLGSPHYGERWARKWLDLARYADTNGYEKDRPRTMWPYRDWVIRALNADMPFDEFTIQQLAGDMLPDATTDQLIATGFHRNTMLNEEGGIDPLEFRFYAMTDRVATTATTWMGLTMGCAQCHTHKYDPITHREYYQVMALLNNADEPDLELWDAAEEQVYQRQREEAADLLAQLPQQWPLPDGANPADRHDVVQRAFEAWVARERAATRQWIELCPDRATSNLPLLTVQADQSVFVSGDITKDDTYELDFTDVPAGITAVRLEVLPDARLPARGPGLTYFEGPKGDFFLGEFRVLREDQTLPISRATESYAKNHFGALPVSAQLATDGDPQTGWSCADRYGEPHQAVFVLQEPLAAAGPLRVTMRFGRHFPASLGRFRLAVTTDPRGAEARSLPREVEQVLTVEDRHWTAAQRDQVWETFLLSAPELKEPAARIHALLRRPTVPAALILRERPPEHPRPTHVHRRGEFLQATEEVTGGVPAFLPPLPADTPHNRLAFARALVSPDHPLTARVQVNRHWAALFGRGLVRTEGDFGVQGEPPTHPELLDYLAVEFIERGWSVKQLHRLLVCSATYRQSAQVTPDQLARDPQNRWLSRFSRVRVDAELVRDIALRASGLLVPTLYGPPVYPPQPEGATETAYGGAEWPTSSGPDRYRRGIYTFLKRTAPYAMYNTFDAPSGEVCLAQREASNTPLQSLALLNDAVFLEAAEHLGMQLAQVAGGDEERVRQLFQRCLTRDPRPAELTSMRAFAARQRARLAAGELAAGPLRATRPGPAENAPDPALNTQALGEQAVWTMLARVVLNLDETITRN